MSSRFSSSPHVYSQDPLLIDDEQGARAIVDQEDIESEVEKPQDKEPQQLQGNLTTIFSIWNTMMGSSLLAIPWGFAQSGTWGGIITMVIIGIVCYYTCYLIVKHGPGYDDFFDLCHDYLGRGGQLLCWGASLLVLMGALMAYDRLMSNCLYDSVNGIRDYISNETYESSKFWSDKISPLIIFITLFPITNFKEMTLLIKINSYGLICVIYVMVFIFYTSITRIETDELPPRFDSNFPKFAGILTVSFFIHSCILPILKNARYPENNTRNLGIAFFLAGLSYGSIGFVAYLAYYPKGVKDDILQLSSDQDVPAIIARLAVLFQLATVFPLVIYIARCQFFGLISGSTYPSMTHVVVLNLVICIICTCVSIWYPHIGDILRFTGAASGLIYVFILPIGVHMLKTYPASVRINEDVDSPTPYMNMPSQPIDQSLVHITAHSPGHVQHTTLVPDRVYERRGWIFWSSCVFHGFLIAFGTASLVGQFVN